MEQVHQPLVYQEYVQLKLYQLDAKQIAIHKFLCSNVKINFIAIKELMKVQQQALEIATHVTDGWLALLIFAIENKIVGLIDVLIVNVKLLMLVIVPMTNSLVQQILILQIQNVRHF